MNKLFEIFMSANESNGEIYKSAPSQEREPVNIG